MPKQKYSIEDPKHWSNDFVHESGNYINTCVICKENFRGHKRRVICKVCQDNIEAAGKHIKYPLSPL